MSTGRTSFESHLLLPPPSQRCFPANRPPRWLRTTTSYQPLFQLNSPPTNPQTDGPMSADTVLGQFVQKSMARARVERGTLWPSGLKHSLDSFSSTAARELARTAAPMSYMFTSSSFPKVRQEGFNTAQQQQQANSNSQQGQRTISGQSQGQQQQSIPAPNAFDPNSIYTTGALFAEQYRATTADPFARRYEQQTATQHQRQQNASLDIHDELSFLNPPTSATSETFQHSRPHDIFGVNQPHYPSLSLPHNSRALYSREEFSSTTPASLHNSYGRSDFFPTNQQPSGASTTQTGTPNETSRHQGDQQPQQQQQQQQQFGIVPSAITNTSASMDNFNPGGEQAASSGVTRSRSRSRSKVSASRSRVSKRPSLPAAPREEGDESPDQEPVRTSSRPSAIVIPGHPGHQHHSSQHSFSSYHAGTTSPATWGFPQSAVAEQFPEGSAGHQLFGQSYQSGLGLGQSPTTHNGSPPAGATIDAAAKLALANEKRRKRRESHNAVERRRRDNINEKIQELAMLLPEEWLEGASPNLSGNGKGFSGPSIAGILSGTVSGSALGSAAGSLDDDSKEIKANKGVILRNSVEYIKNLVQLVQIQRSRNQQLESELAQYRNRFGNMMGGTNGGNISLGGSTPDGLSPAAGMALSSAGGVTAVSAEDDTMSGYVLDSISSPDGFDMKTIFGTGVGPLDTIGNMNTSGMDGIESTGAQLGFAAPGMNMGVLGIMNNGAVGNGMGMPSNSQSPVGPITMVSAANGNLPAMLLDTTSPSTGSDEPEDDDRPRGRAVTRFPAGVGKVEEEPATL